MREWRVLLEVPNLSLNDGVGSAASSIDSCSTPMDEVGRYLHLRGSYLYPLCSMRGPDCPRDLRNDTAPGMSPYLMVGAFLFCGAWWARGGVFGRSFQKFGCALVSPF
jgi:hypothetical protein